MSLIKRNNGSLATRTLLSDFFDTNSFFNDRFFRNLSPDGEWVPAVNIIENEKDYAVELSAPGMKKDDFKIDVTNGVLNISAETKVEKEEKKKNYTRQEFRYESFSRSFTLPENISEENIAAKYEDGVLKLTIAKKAVVPQKHREISVA